MKASPSNQRQILDIQNFDFSIATLKNKAANLPEIAEINKLQIRADNARDLRIAAQTEASDVQRELTRAEGDVEQVVTRITRDEGRLNSGTGSYVSLVKFSHYFTDYGRHHLYIGGAVNPPRKYFSGPSHPHFSAFTTIGLEPCSSDLDLLGFDDRDRRFNFYLGSYRLYHKRSYHYFRYCCC